MNVLQKTEQEKSVLRWGGLAGIVGSMVFIFTFVFVSVFVGLDPDLPADWVIRFPDIRAARTIENSLFLIVLILWVPHFLALYHALRGTRLAPALFGSVLGIVGLVVLAVEALPHVAQAPISDLYHDPGATAGDQATLVFLWQAIQGILDAIFIVGMLIVPIGLIMLGVAMLKAPSFGKGLGRMSVLLGVLGVIAASLLVVDPASILGGIVGVFVLIIFHLVLGWRVYSLSRAM